MTDPAWPLWADDHPKPTCPSCGRPVTVSALFCEACGTPLAPSAPAPAPPPAGPAQGSTQTRRLGSRASEVTTCPACGGTIDADGYCQVCGAKAPSLRDHHSEAPAGWVGGVCDRGREHSRNEDAMALWAHDQRAVLVVCDGVSTSTDADVASRAAALAASQVLTAFAESDEEDGASALVRAAEQANQAVVATTAADSVNAGSATFAAAVVVPGRIHYANLGDSRVYFLGEQHRLLLSLDDSLAQAFIAEGMPRTEAEALPRAHAITKWLGRDAVDIVPRTGSLQPTEPGWLVVCSDGLWNYASSPDDLAVQLTAALAAGTEPVAAAQRLVDWANAQGGHDNITVALARCTVAARLDEDSGAPITASGAPSTAEEQARHG